MHHRPDYNKLWMKSITRRLASWHGTRYHGRYSANS